MGNEKLPGGNVLMVTGMFLAAFGVLALISPVAAGGMVIRVVALILAVTGCMLLVQAFRSTQQADKLTAYTLGAVTVLLAGLMWFETLGGGFLSVLLMAFFVAHGFWKTSTAIRYRASPGWLWLLASGLISWLFVVLLWRQWPLSGQMAVGILVGVDLLLSGIALILLARNLKALARNG
jgi:uncharacterized membrane protein HdeD (DUF308 family)